MKTSQSLLGLQLILILISCQEELPIGEAETFWVYSYPVPCENSTTQFIPCLGISRAEVFDFNWFSLERIPFEMEGFTFSPYYFQKLEVLKKIDPKSGEIKRKLIRVLAEEKDHYEQLEGGWRVKRYLDEDLPNPSFPNGQSVNILPGIRMAVSTDGCNQLILEIRKVGPNKILSFGSLTSTARGCFNELHYPPFPGIGANFKREGNVLTFYSDTEEEVAVWEKLN